MSITKDWATFYQVSDINSNDNSQVMLLNTVDYPTLSQQNQRTPVTNLLRSGKNLGDLTNAGDALINLGLQNSSETLDLAALNLPVISNTLSLTGAYTYFLPYKLQRNGNMVSFTYAGFFVPPTANTFLSTATGAIPAGYRPSLTAYDTYGANYLVQAQDNGNLLNGVVSVYDSGQVYFRSQSFANWTVSASQSGCYGTTIWWYAD